MRMLMHVQLPLEPFNTAVRDGTAGQKIQRILEAIKPEAVYFSEQNGRRGGTLVVNVKDPSEVPMLAEPWFLTFNAEVEFRIAMTPEDLARANLELRVMHTAFADLLNLADERSSGRMRALIGDAGDDLAELLEEEMEQRRRR